MAKKASQAVNAPENEFPGKTRVELRFDTDVYGQIKSLADAAGISVNQLMHGLARWVGQHGRVGEPYHDGQGRVQERRQPGCVWVGQPSEYYELEAREAAAEATNCSVEDIPEYSQGQVRLALDFTERRVVRELPEDEQTSLPRNTGTRRSKQNDRH